MWSGQNRAGARRSSGFFGIDRELRIVELGMNEWMSVVLVVDVQGRENLDELHVTFT